MNIELINRPTISLWSSEIQSIVRGKKNFAIGRLGTYAAFIDNVFHYTSKENTSLSIGCFEEAFEELINSPTHYEEVDSIEFRLSRTSFILNVINSFKSSVGFCTLKTKYLRYAIELVEVFLENENQVKVFRYQGLVFDFCLFVKTYNRAKESEFLQSPFLLEGIIRNLKKTIGISEKISALSSFLLLTLEEKDILIINSWEILADIVRYCISTKNVTNHRLNNLIIKFATSETKIFNTILKDSKCKMGNNCNTILFHDQTVKNLEPTLIQWEKLNDLFGSQNTAKEILQLNLEKELTL